MLTANPNKIKQSSAIANVILYVFALIVCVVTLYPMYYVLIMSISDPSAVAAMSVTLYPKGFYLDCYRIIFGDTKMWTAYGNTIFYVVAGTVLNCTLSLLGAYPLTVKKLFARKWVVRYIIIPMYFSGGIIPAFLLINKLGLYDTRLAIIIPGAVSIWNIILVRTNFMTLPESLRESAFLDGASSIQVLFKIYAPISKPILAVIAIYSIVGIWNSWFDAMIYLPNERLHPLQMYLYRVLVQQSVDLSKLKNYQDVQRAIKRMLTATQLKYAIIIFTTLPVIFTYPFFQKYFIKGAMLGSLKG